MSLYLDASLLVPLVVAETQHPDIWAFLAQHPSPFVVTSFARGEAASALGRLVRKRVLGESDAQARLIELEAWCATVCAAPPVEDGDIRAASAFLRRFDLGLRLPDALHLACARRLGLPLMTLDLRLIRAGDALGIAVNLPA